MKKWISILWNAYKSYMTFKCLQKKGFTRDCYTFKTVIKMEAKLYEQIKEKKNKF